MHGGVRGDVRGGVRGAAYTIQMWCTNCSVSDSSLLLVWAPNRPSYTTCWEEQRVPEAAWPLPPQRVQPSTHTWMLAGKHSAARRERSRWGRIFSLTRVLTGSCFSSCFRLPAYRAETPWVSTPPPGGTPPSKPCF